ncbi:MAG TPA: hypothetical protein VGM78_02035 [Ilumatobacteraceae bacterium]
MKRPRRGLANGTHLVPTLIAPMAVLDVVALRDSIVMVVQDGVVRHRTDTPAP